MIISVNAWKLCKSIGIGLLVASALKMSGATEKVSAMYSAWLLRRAQEGAAAEVDRSREIEARAEVEPALRPLLPAVRASVDGRRQQLVLEASELAYEVAGERFDDSRRLADEGRAIVSSATALGNRE